MAAVQEGTKIKYVFRKRSLRLRENVDLTVLEKLLPPHFEAHDFDERGVPNNAGHGWRLGETRYWIEEGRKKSEAGVMLVVCGFANPDEIEGMQMDFPELQIGIILLDADAQVIENRLRSRNANAAVAADLERAVGNADAFIENNTKFVAVLREICQRHKCSIIDTTNLSPEMVAQKVAEIIYKKGPVSAHGQGT